MRFEQPLALLLALPWLAFWALLYGHQRRALAWIEAHVDARFRPALTLYRPRTFAAHLGWLAALGLLLVLAAARPVATGSGELSGGGRLLVLLDASASMYATDVEPLAAGAEAPANRFELARQVAARLAAELEEYHVAVATWSGVAALQLPPTGDRALVAEALRTAEAHTFYQSSGSDLGAALDVALHFAGKDAALGPPDLQAVLLGDGELPRELPYEDPLAALAERGVAVHALTLGSREGQARLIYDFRDVRAGKEEKRVLREYTTRREDGHFRRVADETGGYFAVVSNAAVAELVEAIRQRAERGARVEDEAARRDLAALPLGIFLAAWLVDALLMARRRPPRFDFDLERLGEPRAGSRDGSRDGASSAVAGRRRRAVAAGLVVVGLLACEGDSPLERAHAENQRGIALDLLGSHAAARVHYERSLAYGVSVEIPTHNLGRSAVLAEEPAEAHDLFQRALELAPGLAEAHYNDGVALFRWGVAERDPRGCELERTLDLWRQAQRRFAGIAELEDVAPALARDAETNRRALAVAIAKLYAQIDSPPPRCRSESPAGGMAPPPPTEPPPPDEPPPPGEPPPVEPPPPGEPPPPEEPPPTEPPPAAGALGAEELAEIERELERIAAQSREDGKYHRRSRAEQFPKEAWENPEAEIWW